MSRQYKRNYIPSNVIQNSSILPQPGRMLSRFNLSESLSTTMKFDNLYPVYWKELNPNDHFKIDIKCLARLMPVVAPTMSNLKMTFFAFWVPNRLLWEHWVNFMGEKKYQSESTEYIVPQISLNSSEHNVSGGIADYLGIPPTGNKVTKETVSALPFRCYNKIWNDWFISNDLQAPLKEFSDDNKESRETLADYKLQKKAKPMDYFTSCTPHPIAGEDVKIGLTGNAPIEALTTKGVKPVVMERKDGFTGYATNALYAETIVNTPLYADMSKVSGVSIEALRRAVALQELLEKDNRAGNLYIDIMRAHFGVDTPDFLVGRSQFLGRHTVDIGIEPIAQTGETGSKTPQGNLSGVGVGIGADELCEISAVEHGHLMILACAEGEVSYQQGLNRDWSKKARFDYLFPEFWNLGDQSILNKEIYLAPDSEGVDNNGVFGYQERYREYREGISKVSGKMRSGVDGSLDVWHLAQKFNNQPKLNAEFIACNTPVDRIMAVQEEDELVVNLYFDIKADRGLPLKSNPSILAGRL